ncbi:MAG: hypothetical protein LBV50_06935 [Novosphingobium sp.]|nr:hypothetical protein [Novosphingobium sp.]
MKGQQGAVIQGLPQALRAGFPIFANFTHNGHGKLFAAAGNVPDNQQLRQ